MDWMTYLVTAPRAALAQSNVVVVATRQMLIARKAPMTTVILHGDSQRLRPKEEAYRGCLRRLNHD